MNNIPVYALVCLDWNGQPTYTSFYEDKDKAIETAERMAGVIRVEEAHSNKPPIWVMTR